MHNKEGAGSLCILDLGLDDARIHQVGHLGRQPGRQAQAQRMRHAKVWAAGQVEGRVRAPALEVREGYSAGATPWRQAPPGQRGQSECAPAPSCARSP